jgi:hypothetical protein
MAEGPNITISFFDRIAELENVAGLGSAKTPLEHGGTAADLSGTGGAGQVVMQEAAGDPLTVRKLTDADLPVRDIAVASASGAITAKEGTVVITKATAAALTLAAPASPADNGKILRIISTTAAAHTVTQTTPGFNGGGEGADVGTFGGAIGDNLVLLAYGGVWHVLSSVNVTIA